MEGGEAVAYNIGLTASLKVSKPDNYSKTVSFSSNSEESINSFRDSLRKAVRDRSQNEMETDDITALKKELVCKSKSKLKIKGRENDKPVEENGEKQIEKKEIIIEKDITIEEILCEPELLANMQQMGEIPADKQIVLIEKIEEVLNELLEVQTGSIEIKDSNMQVKMAELTTLIEGIQKELEANGSFTYKEEATDFTNELKAIVAEYTEKIKAASKTTTDNSTAELNKLQMDSKENEIAASHIAAETMPDKELSVQKSVENDNLTAEAAEEQKYDIKAVTKEAQTASEENADDIKTALDSKVVKVTVDRKEGKRQDAEVGDNKEAAKEIYKATNTAQNKPINEEMTALKQEQIVVDNKFEAVQDQAVPVKAQTVSKAEIINQIVRKAEIIFNDVQSEMRMQLEPENLGKLTLKIAVEKGLITAKFSTESYEVKQIIESSFNELKDMLQEKGLLIQNLSVSVGQNNSEYNNGNDFYQWKEKIKLRGRSMNAGIYNGYLEGELIAASKVNPYNIHNGEFDHRA